MEQHRQNVIELQTQYGTLQVPDHENDLIGRFLRTYGEWAPYELQFIANSIKAGARVADIGAFVGTFGLGLMAHLPLGSVCFVEANSRIVPLLQNNVAHNATAPSVVVDAAIIPASMRGVVSASVEADNAGSFSISGSETVGRMPAELLVKQLTLHELRAQHGPFDLIKLDIEGLENALLQDDAEFIASGAAELWVECNENPASISLCQTLLDAGLDVYYCAFPVFANSNYNGSCEIIFPWAYESGLWATRGVAPMMDSQLAEAGCFLTRIYSTTELRQKLWDTPRWSPMDWSKQTFATVVARACHIILGERFEDYLKSTCTIGKRSNWADPLPIQMQRELDRQREQSDIQCRQFESEKTELQAAARASEVMLHAEREWIETQCRRFESEIDGLKLQSNRLSMFEASNVYRLIVSVNNFATRWPRLYRFARSVAARVWRIVYRARHSYLRRR
ncbi:MAG: FkbM family methyltransferase [Acidiphilium sp.]